MEDLVQVTPVYLDLLRVDVILQRRHADFDVVAPLHLHEVHLRESMLVRGRQANVTVK